MSKPRQIREWCQDAQWPTILRPPGAVGVHCNSSANSAELAFYSRVTVELKRLRDSLMPNKNEFDQAIHDALDGILERAEKETSDEQSR